jgi:tetratricopeptide (TPR) repeat protein
LSSKPSGPQKNRWFSPEVLASGAITVCAPILLGILARICLPLQWLSTRVPLNLQSFVADGKNVGELIFAFGEMIFFPIALYQASRKVYGFHVKGKYQSGKINIWVAELDGDTPDHKWRGRMMASLKSLFGDSIEVLSADILPRVVDTTGRAGQEADEGNLLAQKYLEDNQGELSLWGEFFGGTVPMMELRLVSVAQDGRLATPFEYDWTTYRPVDKKFRPHFTAALAALVATMAQGADDDSGEYVAEFLRPLATKIGVLARKLPTEMRYEERARIFQGLGKLFRIIGSEDDSIPKLRLAIQMLLRSRSCWRRLNGASSQAAATMSELGRAYWQLGQRSKGTTFLHASLRTLDCALQTFRPDGDFVAWAHCRLGKSAAHYFLGSRLDSYVDLELGSQAADAVLLHPDLNSFPKLYARALNVLAMNYVELGRLDRNYLRLGTAIETFRKLAKIWTKEAEPLYWGTTQSNIAVSIIYLYNLTDRKELLDESWAACELALEVISPHRNPGFYGKVKSMQGLILYFQREFKQAKDHYLDALNTLSRETNEFEYLKVVEEVRLCDEQLFQGLVVVLGDPASKDAGD